MLLGQFLQNATKQLTNAGIDSARLDCLILLEDVLGTNRASLLAHPEIALNGDQIATLNNLITQRLGHKPLAYIRGKAPFYGREFMVNEHVLVPRPETETMIDLLRELPLNGHINIADVGTGSGCIGITASLEVPKSSVMLIDIDASALKVARANAKRLKATVGTVQQDILSDVEAQFDVVLANLPYVPTEYPINTAAQHEPRLALFSGYDGLDHYRTFWGQIKALRHPPRYILTESLTEQHATLLELAEKASYKNVTGHNLIQVFER